MSKKNKRITNNSARVIRITIRKGEGRKYLSFMPGDKNVVSAADWALAMENRVGKIYTQEGNIRNRVGKVVKGLLLEVADVEKEVTVDATKTRMPAVTKQEEKKPAKKDAK